MGRPGLSHHPKFLMLARTLGEVVARGVLELVWEVSYESGDDRLGGPDAVEAAARWRGERGVCFAALRDAVGQSTVGFIEERAGVWFVHDLWDHAPDYVRKRAAREEQRRTKGRSLASERRAETGQGAGGVQALTPPPAPAPTRAPSTQEEDLPRAAPAPLLLEGVASDPPTFGPTDLQALWNERLVRHGLQRWDAMVGKRKAATAARLREHPEPAWWERVFAGVRASAFLCGDPGPWRAGPDWLMKPGSAESVLEGKYAGRPVSGRGRGIPDPNQGIVTHADPLDDPKALAEATRRQEEWLDGG